MTARTAAGAGFLLLGALTGCSDPEPGPVAAPSTAVTAVRTETTSPPPAAAPTRTTQAPAPPTPEPARTTPPAGDLNQFVALVRERLPEFVIDRRDDEVAALGEQTCAALQQGRRDAAVVAVMHDEGVTTADARTLLALARRAACPT
ncbi:DUF732 domain-containing protein [Actinoplanes sp. LDG1-06]|uniref:DUF732 domain-containing protein n=1 Tax=Paractinoplanes ovalisporus TaxID=2810368 RepID=A0ABS2AS06_9ACTN|nr:DUF732 domain-containing protein [Actinoplanes ovalisporus]MBM2622633.1 DUF732 domain-containing protein [Actinoplanes ovalisporus]